MNRVDANDADVDAERMLLNDLRAIGIPLKSIWSDTTHIKRMPPQAFKIILSHLRSGHPRKLREGMARALARREARDIVWGDVLALYKTEHDEPGARVQEGLASAIHAMARPADIDVLIDLLKDSRNGTSRIFFLRNLSRSNNPKAFEALYELQEDADLKTEISRILKRRKARLLLPLKTRH